MIEKWITFDPEILSGKPIIKGTRISVAVILQCIASGMTVEGILRGYPTLTREGVLAALEFTAQQMAGEEIRTLEKA
jgi:uncharacterized protein (DUF433 family)